MRLLLLLALLVPLTAAPRAQGELVIHTEGTSLYHRAGCPTLKGRQDIVALTRAQAETRGYKPHPECDPALQDAEGQRRSAAPPPTVYLNGTKYYHRKECRRLQGADAKVRTASLETAGKSHWPCPDCSPPVRRRSTEPAVPGTGRRGR